MKLFNGGVEGRPDEPVKIRRTVNRQKENLTVTLHDGTVKQYQDVRRSDNHGGQTFVCAPCASADHFVTVTVPRDALIEITTHNNPVEVVGCYQLKNVRPGDVII